MKKKFDVMFTIIACFAIMLFSYISWTTKLDDIKKEATKVAPISTAKADNKGDESSDPNSQKSLTEVTLKKAIANSDAAVQGLFEKRFGDDQKVKMLIVGSEAMNAGGDGYAKRLEASLQETYGEFIKVTSNSFDTTSAAFIANHLDDIKWEENYDLVLLEPFILNDNGLVSIEDELTYIDQIIVKVQAAVKDAVVVIQPSYPIFNTTYYGANVAKLQTYAKDYSLPYISHWDKWPSTSDLSLNSYLTVRIQTKKAHNYGPML